MTRVTTYPGFECLSYTFVEGDKNIWEVLIDVLRNSANLRPCAPCEKRGINHIWLVIDLIFKLIVDRPTQVIFIFYFYLCQHTYICLSIQIQKTLAGMLVIEGDGQTEFHGVQYPGKVT